LILKDMICKIFGPGKKSSTPALLEARNAGNSAAIIFVHGFHGKASATWSSFVTQLLSDRRLSDWDVYSAGYSTSLSIDLPIWTSDPEVRLCAAGLATKLRHAPLDRYKAIALVAHSMGGLVVQRAIIKNDELRRRLTHVVLFGTPSAGVLKAVLGARLKPQARDMCEDSVFIKQLRQEWQEEIGDNPSFSFTVVAGETDAFIPASSSIYPFPSAQQAVVPGNHLEIVRPDSVDHPSYALLFKTLTNSRGYSSATESGRLAVEQKEFDRAIELLMPGANGLDADAIVSLALALESVGRKNEAVDVIERWNHAHESLSLDPIGVLAGRLKRRWLVSRQQQDLDRALELYSAGLERAEACTDHEQAYYHAINVAYLRLVSSPGGGPASSSVKDMAKRALSHVKASRENQWSLATTGEVFLMLGDVRAGVGAYRKARKLAKNLRECESMHMQAVAVAARLFGEEGAKLVDGAFEL
jgi:pimeloyl-ACP methyl ester carboxylesterase